MASSPGPPASQTIGSGFGFAAAAGTIATERVIVRPFGRRRVEIGLVHHDHVGQFHNAALDRLQVVAGVGHLQQHEGIDHAGHRGF